MKTFRTDAADEGNGISSEIPMIQSRTALKTYIDERNMVKIEAIIRSMTVKERRNPDLLNPSRKERIAKGSGTTLADVNRLVKQFTQTRKMMKQVGNIAKKGRNPFGGIRMPF